MFPSRPEIYLSSHIDLPTKYAIHVSPPRGYAVSLEWLKIPVCAIMYDDDDNDSFDRIQIPKISTSHGFFSSVLVRRVSNIRKEEGVCTVPGVRVRKPLAEKEPLNNGLPGSAAAGGVDREREKNRYFRFQVARIRWKYLSTLGGGKDKKRERERETSTDTWKRAGRNRRDRGYENIIRGIIVLFLFFFFSLK